MAETSVPDDETLMHFLVGMRPLLVEGSGIHLQAVWDAFISDLPEERSAEHGTSLLGNELTSLMRGVDTIRWSIDGKELTTSEIYTMLSEGAYFRENSHHDVHLKAASEFGFGPALWYQFYEFNLRAFRVASNMDRLFRARTRRDLRSGLHRNYTCIYCRGTKGPFDSEEHVYPESLGNNEAILPRGHVCTRCNNGPLSRLDEILISFAPISFLRVYFAPYTKKGKVPRATFSGHTLYRPRPATLVLAGAGKTSSIRTLETTPDGRTRFELSLTGKRRFDPVLLGRALYKVALGMVAFQAGRKSALSPRYDAARKFISKKCAFDNVMLMRTIGKPEARITTRWMRQDEGTFFMISIYGMYFLINLEEMPKLTCHAELAKEGFVGYSLAL